MKLGAHTRTQTKGVQEIDVDKMIAHERYVPEPEFTNDIGLLKLTNKYRTYGTYIHRERGREREREREREL